MVISFIFAKTSFYYEYYLYFNFILVFASSWHLSIEYEIHIHLSV